MASSQSQVQKNLYFAQDCGYSGRLPTPFP